MNPNGPHHNIWVHRFGAQNPSPDSLLVLRRHGEQGYTLVALLALMTVVAIFAAAAAPNLQQQMVRERETEAIFRGEQVEEAIRLYYLYQLSRGTSGEAALPTSMDQLGEGISIRTKKVQILRASAMKDPLSKSGEWQLVQLRSNELGDFQRALMVYAANIRPPTSDKQLQPLELLIPPVLPGSTPPTHSGSSNNAGNVPMPFIGVGSEDKRDSIMYYYGIDHHDGWVFTPMFR